MAPACPATVAAIFASCPQLAHACAPQPLNTQSTAPSAPCSSSTNVGPMSRIHASSSWACTSSTRGSRCRCASGSATGSTTIVTGSNSSTACATAAHVVRASSGSSPSR